MMFVTPKWDIGDVNEKLNFELFGDSSYSNKKLKKNKKKKKNFKSDGPSPATKNNLNNFSATPVECDIKKLRKNNVELHSISKLKKVKNLLSKRNTKFSSQGNEKLMPPSIESKVDILQNTKKDLNPGIKRKHSVSFDSDLYEHKSKKQKKIEISSKNDEVLIQNDSGKELHSSEKKLFKNQKRKQTKKKRRTNTLTDPTSFESKALLKKSVLITEKNVQDKPDKEIYNSERKLSRKEKRRQKKKRANVLTNPSDCESKDLLQKALPLTEENHQSDGPTKQHKMGRLKNKLKKTTDVETKDLLQTSVPKLDIQNDGTDEQKSPYKIEKLKNLLENLSNSEHPFKQNISLSKKKNEGTLRERMMRKLKASRFRYLNEQLYTSGGKDSKEFFETEPEAFLAYHEGYQQQVQQWPINPLDVIIKSLQKKSSELVIADFGCGDARLSRSVKNLVHSFDLMAVSKEVTACDMARTPLSNASVDIVVFCLSLMGNNLARFLVEANRVLKEGGLMKIAEVESRFDNIETFIHNVNRFGFVNTWKDLSHNLFYFLDFKKERCISKKMKSKLPEITLKPCLYKKR